MEYGSTKRDMAEVMDDMKNHPWKTLGILTVLGLAAVGSIFLTSLLVAYANNFVNGKTQSPRAVLDSYYRKVSEATTTDGLYITTYDVFVHMPPFWSPKDPRKSDAPFAIGRHFEGECTEIKPAGSVQETNGAFSSSTVQYETTCKTYRPIIDTGQLFTIKED